MLTNERRSCDEPDDRDKPDERDEPAKLRSARALITILGATGAVGRPLAAALASRASQNGWRLRFVGRDLASLRELAERFDAEWWRVSELSLHELGPALSGSTVVVNLVGPFAATAQVVTSSALAEGCHYLDAANEYTAVSAVLDRDREARDQAVTLMPAVGFGTVATEGLAAAVAEEIGSDAGGSISRVNVAMFPRSAARSRGASTSVAEVLADGGAAIESGRLVRFALGHRTQRLAGPHGPTTLIPAATGDLAAIPATLGARVVTSSVGLPVPRVGAAAALPLVSAAMRSRLLRRAVDARAGDRAPKTGELVSYSWARVTGESGGAREAWLRAGEGYDFTVQALAGALERVLDTFHTPARAGALTATAAFGPAFLRSVAGVSIHSSLNDALAAGDDAPA